MTDAGRHGVSVRRSAVVSWLAFAGTVAVGRWATGPGFGFAIFAAVWGPIAALMLPDVLAARASGPCALLADTGETPVPRENARRSVSLLKIALRAGLTVVPFAAVWVTDLPVRSAVAEIGWLTLFVSAVVGVGIGSLDDGRRGVSRHTVVLLLWLTWLTIPLTRVDGLTAVLGEAKLAWLLEVHPILLLNAADATAGDWTHQNLAYAHLTRLGQDVAFAWADQVWLPVLVYAGITTAGIVLNVPRGTLLTRFAARRRSGA